jgi:hypothetical protein
VERFRREGPEVLVRDYWYRYEAAGILTTALAHSPDAGVRVAAVLDQMILEFLDSVPSDLRNGLLGEVCASLLSEHPTDVPGVLSTARSKLLQALTHSPGLSPLQLFDRGDSPNCMLISVTDIWDWVEDKAKKVGEGIGDLVDEAIDGVKDAVDEAVDGAKRLVGGVVDSGVRFVCGTAGVVLAIPLGIAAAIAALLELLLTAILLALLILMILSLLWMLLQRVLPPIPAPTTWPTPGIPPITAGPTESPEEDPSGTGGRPGPGRTTDVAIPDTLGECICFYEVIVNGGAGDPDGTEWDRFPIRTGVPCTSDAVCILVCELQYSSADAYKFVLDNLTLINTGPNPLFGEFIYNLKVKPAPDGAKCG